MYRAALRSAPRIASPLCRSTVASSGRRFASTAAGEKRGWKSTTARYAVALGAVYYYSTSSVFAEEPEFTSVQPPPEFSDKDLPTIEAIVAEKRREAEARQKAASIPSDPEAVPAETVAATTTASEVNGEPGQEGGPAELEEEAAQQGAFNPETGEINWDCPCLGGMAHGPCGEEFKSAFSCFVYSKEEPKGMDCIDKFQHMQDCFRLHPEVYGDELADDDNGATEGAETGEIAAGEIAAREAPAELPAEPLETTPATKDVAELDATEAPAKPEAAREAIPSSEPEAKEPNPDSTEAK